MADPSRKELQEGLENWARTPELAKAEARQEANDVGWRIYLITVAAAALIAAVMASALTYTFLWAWSSDWQIEHASGRDEKCSRSNKNLLGTPHYVCVELP